MCESQVKSKRRSCQPFRRPTRLHARMRECMREGSNCLRNKTGPIDQRHQSAFSHALSRPLAHTLIYTFTSANQSAVLQYRKYGMPCCTKRTPSCSRQFPSALPWTSPHAAWFRKTIPPTARAPQPPPACVPRPPLQPQPPAKALITLPTTSLPIPALVTAAPWQPP